MKLAKFTYVFPQKPPTDNQDPYVDRFKSNPPQKQQRAHCNGYISASPNPFFIDRLHTSAKHLQQYWMRSPPNWVVPNNCMGLQIAHARWQQLDIEHMKHRCPSTCIFIPTPSMDYSPQQLPSYLIHRQFMIVRWKQVSITIHCHLKTTVPGESLHGLRRHSRLNPS